MGNGDRSRSAAMMRALPGAKASSNQPRVMSRLSRKATASSTTLNTQAPSQPTHRSSDTEAAASRRALERATSGAIGSLTRR